MTTPIRKKHQHINYRRIVQPHPGTPYLVFHEGIRTETVFQIRSVLGRKPIEEGPYADKNEKVAALAEKAGKANRQDGFDGLVRYLIEELYQLNEEPEIHRHKTSVQLFHYPFYFKSDFNSQMKQYVPRLNQGELLTAGTFLDMSEPQGVITEAYQTAMVAVSVIRQLGYTAYLGFADLPAGMNSMHDIFAPAVAVFNAGGAGMVTFEILPVHGQHSGITLLGDDAAMALVYATSGELRTFRVREEIAEYNAIRKGNGYHNLEIATELLHDKKMREDLNEAAAHFAKAYELWPNAPGLAHNIFTAMDMVQRFASTIMMFANQTAQGLGPEISMNPEIMRMLRDADHAAIELQNILWNSVPELREKITRIAMEVQQAEMAAQFQQMVQNPGESGMSPE